jgi:uncharacterized protein
MQARPLDIAVIGGGIAGLVAAWRLAPLHRVTLFERHAAPGFIASSVAVPGASAEPLRVDVPLRVFYPGYYPTLTRLYAELGVATQPVNYATTFTGADGRAYFRWRNLRLGGWSWPYVLPQDVAGARARRVVAGALRFQAQVRGALAAGELRGISIGDFVATLRLPAEFVDGLLLPALATIATCSTEDALAYPAEVVAAYAAAGVARQSVRRVRDGADAVAARLLAGLPRVLCSAGVSAVHGADDGAWVQHAQGRERFDHVVLATQANQALALLPEATAAERGALAGFRYRALEVVMHRDTALMPARRADWSPVNACVSPAFERPESTIWINRVQPGLRGAEPLFQTVMPQRAPREGSVISRARFERPLVDAGSAAALAALQRLQAQSGRRLWFCGSYAEAGVPLLESAVRSALAVADALAAAPVANGLRAESMA